MIMFKVSAAQALRFIMAIGVPEKIPRKGSITAAKLAAEVGSEKTLISMSSPRTIGEGTMATADIYPSQNDAHARGRRNV